MINKEFIDSQKEEIVRQISELENEVRTLKYDEIGSAGEDNALEFEEFEEKVALNKSAQEELKDLKLALKKIEEGTYGKCEKCMLTIEHGRLKAFPGSRFCSTHARTN